MADSNTEMSRRYHRTVKGFITKTYAQQRAKCKRRGYELPTYSKAELSEWILSQSNFVALWDAWVSSNYDTALIPSIDRIDDYQTYSLTNIRLVAWEENRIRYYTDSKSGVNNKVGKTVNQYTRDGEFVAWFHSAQEAARALGKRSSHISECCRNERNSAYDYIWAYARH